MTCRNSPAVTSSPYLSSRLTETPEKPLTNLAEPTVVVVCQLQALRPYNGSTNWKLFRDHFKHVVKVNSWVTTIVLTM